MLKIILLFSTILLLATQVYSYVPDKKNCYHNGKFLVIRENYKLTQNFLDSMPDSQCFGFIVKGDSTLDLNGLSLDFKDQWRWAAIVLKGHKSSVISTSGYAHIKNALSGVVVNAYISKEEALQNNLINVIWSENDQAGDLKSTWSKLETVSPWKIKTSSEAWKASSYLRLDNHKIQNINFKNIKRKAIYVDPYARNILISNNIIDRTGDMAIYLDSHSGMVTIENNIIKNCSTGAKGLPCIAIDGSRRNIIQHNQIGPLSKPNIPSTGSHRKSALISLYRNCGEFSYGTIYRRWINAGYNQILYNDFFIKQDDRHKLWVNEFGGSHDTDSEYLTAALNLNARYDWNLCNGKHRIEGSLQDKSANLKLTDNVHDTKIEYNNIYSVIEGPLWKHYIISKPKVLNLKGMFIRYENLDTSTGRHRSKNASFKGNTATFKSAISWNAPTGNFYYKYDWRKTGIASMTLIYRDIEYNIDNKIYRCTSRSKTCWLEKH